LNDRATFAKGRGEAEGDPMLGDAVLYAIRRAASTAIQNVERQAAWTAAGSIFLLCALVTALIAAYQTLLPLAGAVGAVALIGIACGLIGLGCLSLPAVIESERTEEVSTPTPLSAIGGAFNEEASKAVDYFGAVRVVTTAFLFGLGVARRLIR
jgi:hypothetical protein